jgi:hypothetical protein
MRNEKVKPTFSFLIFYLLFFISEIAPPMKNIRTVAVVLVLIQIIYGHVTNFWYYRTIFENVSSNIRPLIQAVCWLATDITLLVCGLLFFISTGAAIRNKSYTLLRFIYVIYALLLIPNLALFFFKAGFYRNMEVNGGQWLFFLALRLLWLATVVTLIIARPVKAVERIDLSEYELVNYTSTWHRFLHYLLDIFFLLPVCMFWVEFIMPGSDSVWVIEGFLILIYVLYCFLSEAFFRQTFGKMITGSCIVSNGADLSAGRVLIRTLSRLIPFDKLSFLFGGNWHDRLSSTTVVYIDSWQKVFDEEPAPPSDKS